MSEKKVSHDSALYVWQMQNELLLDYGVDIINRTFSINRDIDTSMFAEIDAKLAILERDCKPKPLPITIKLNSLGGSIYDAWAICSRIRSSPCPITIEAHGAIMSAATMVFASGKKRKASKFCTFMFHQASAGLEGNLTELERHVMSLKKEEEMYISFLTKMSKKPSSFWKNMLNLKGDVYLSAEQVKKLGIVDEVF